MSPNTPEPISRDPDELEFDRELVMQQSFLASLIRTLGVPASDTNDLLQSTNLYLLENRHLYQDGTNFRAWAAQVARYRCMNFFRNRSTRPTVELNEESAAAVTEELMQSHEETEEQMRHLRDCLKKLTRSQLQLVRAVYESGVSLKDYAISSHISHEAARKMISRIRIQLKECVESAAEI